MAKLRVSPELILAALFVDDRRISIEGAAVDEDGNLVFEISGPSVPDVDFVTAIVTKTAATVEFVPR